MNELLQMMQSFCEKLLQQKQAASIDQSPLQEMSIQDMEDLKQHYLDEMLSLSNDLQIKDYCNEKIDIRFRRESESMIDELNGKFNGISIEINKKKELQHPEQELSTIPEKESDEFIKSSVEDLVPIPCESEDTSESDNDCDLPSCDDFSPINVYEEKSITFSNPLFDSNDNFTSSDDESLSDEDVSEDNFKIYSNPLFEFNDEYISSDVNPLFDEVLENIESKNSYVSNLDELALLVTPLSDFNDGYFRLGSLMGGLGPLLFPRLASKDGQLVFKPKSSNYVSSKGSTSIGVPKVSSTSFGLGLSTLSSIISRSPIGSSYASNHDMHLGLFRLSPCSESMHHRETHLDVVGTSRSSLSRSRPDVVARSLTPSLDRSRRHHFMPVTPSPRSSRKRKRGPEPPIKPPSPDSFRMKEVDHLAIHTPPLPYVTSFHLKDMYCYYHPCIDDPKKHYGFKPGLLGQSGSLDVDFSNIEVIEDDWELEPKEVSFLGRRLNLPIRLKEVENVRIKEIHHLEHIIQQPKF
ncbi:hypothetical protein Tco_0438396 [Tanacetum coccineum]